MKSNLLLIKIMLAILGANPYFVYGVNVKPTFSTEIVPVGENSYNKIIVPEKYFNELKSQSQNIKPINLNFEIEFRQDNLSDLDSFQFFSKNRKNSERNISELVLSEKLDNKIDQSQIFEIIRNAHTHALVHKRSKHSENKNTLLISIPLTHDNIYLHDGKMFFTLLVKDLHQDTKVSEYKLELAPHKIRYSFNLSYSNAKNSQLPKLKLTVDESNVDIDIRTGRKVGVYKTSAKNAIFQDELEADTNGILNSSISMVPKYVLNVDENYIKKHTVTKVIKISDSLKEKTSRKTTSKNTTIKPEKKKAPKKSGHASVEEVKRRILHYIPEGSSFNGAIFSKTIGEGEYNLYGTVAERINMALKVYGQEISVSELIKYNNKPPKKLLPRKLFKGNKIEFNFEGIFNSIVVGSSEFIE